MCMTTGQAHLDSTIIYTGVAERDGKLVHVTLYGNKVKNLASGGNAMILAVPARTLDPKNFIDMTGCSSVLEDMKNASTPVARSFIKSLEPLSLGAVQVFDSGIYTCVVVGPEASIGDVALALAERVPEHKRPSLTPAYLSGIQGAYRRRFDKSSRLSDSLKEQDAHQDPFLMIACFSNREAATDLLGYWYEPTDPSSLFFPGLDDHDGEVPGAGLVDRDHALITGSNTKSQGFPVQYSDAIPPDLRRLLPTYVASYEIEGTTLNGDFTVPVVEIERATRFEARLVRPPGL